MASTQPQKSASRWGSFLSSVESRLDTILADEDPKAQQRARAKISEDKDSQDVSYQSPERNTSPARSISSTRTQERLNERLAKAMANKNVSRNKDVNQLSSETISRASSPVAPPESVRTSEDFQPDLHVNASDKNSQSSETVLPVSGDDDQIDDSGVNHEVSGKGFQATEPPIISRSSGGEKSMSSSDPHPAGDHSQTLINVAMPRDYDSKALSEANGPVVMSAVASDYDEKLIQLTMEKEALDSRRQEESHALLEKIDALQAKLQYFAQEAAEAARTRSAESKQGSLENRIASKDEKIALLVEEGQKLSQAELKHMSVIKKLRAKAAEDEKVLAEAKRLSTKQEQIALGAQEKLKKAEVAERQAYERLKILATVENDLEVTKGEKWRSEALVSDLQKQLLELNSASRRAEDKAREDLLLAARKQMAKVEDDLSSLKAEKDIAEKQHQSSARDLRDKLDRERERGRVAEVEKQGEIRVLESRLEVYRVRAEEVSAGQGGDVQAKLLRQIETLQNQYAVASENWQGIEGTLLTRAGLLEKERDDIAKREADIRRRARESGTRFRHAEEELEKAFHTIEDLKTEQASLMAQIELLKDHLSRTGTELQEAQRDFQNERESWESRQAQRLEDERSRIREEFLKSTPTSIYTPVRNESSYVQNWTRKSSNAAERSSPHSRRVSANPGQSHSNADPSPHDRPLSRRSSAMITDSVDPRISTWHVMNRTDSMSTVPNISLNNGIPETPSIDEIDHQIGVDEESFAGMHTPATPPERTINDLVSASTAAAGPSVQLVERMSATVRRLETEKTAHRDELARLAQQRDDARAQVVELLRDNEGKKAVDEQVVRLEAGLSDLKKRHETTLEMLGEKSERVEELKADIVDLKSLLREMVEERVK